MNNTSFITVVVSAFMSLPVGWIGGTRSMAKAYGDTMVTYGTRLAVLETKIDALMSRPHNMREGD